MQCNSITCSQSQKKRAFSVGKFSEMLEPRMLLSGSTLTTLASFTKGAGQPWNPTGSSLVEDSAGDIFGLTSQVGSTGHNGIFELAKGASTPTLAAEIIPTGAGKVPNGATGG